MILTLLAIQVLAVNLGIFARNFDGNRDRKLGYPGINVTNGETLATGCKCAIHLKHGYYMYFL